MSESREWKPPGSFKWAVLTSDAATGAEEPEEEEEEEEDEEEGDGDPWNRRNVLGPRVMVV